MDLSGIEGVRGSCIEATLEPASGIPQGLPTEEESRLPGQQEQKRQSRKVGWDYFSEKL